MALTPWPSDDTDALADLRASVAGADSLDDARLRQIGQTGAAMVLRYAPDAPAEIRDEGTRRLVGWLIDRDPVQLRSSGLGGELNFSFAMGNSAMMASGVAAMLGPWKRRRALPAEDAD